MMARYFAIDMTTCGRGSLLSLTSTKYWQLCKDLGKIYQNVIFHSDSMQCNKVHQNTWNSRPTLQKEHGCSPKDRTKVLLVLSLYSRLMLLWSYTHGLGRGWDLGLSKEWSYTGCDSLPDIEGRNTTCVILLQCGHLIIATASMCWLPIDSYSSGYCLLSTEFHPQWKCWATAFVHWTWILHSQK